MSWFMFIDFKLCLILMHHCSEVWRRLMFCLQRNWQVNENAQPCLRC